MMSDPARRRARGDGLIYVAHDELGRHSRAKPAPEDLTREQVFDCSDISPTLGGRHIGNVGRPGLVGPFDQEIAGQEVRDDPQLMIGVGRRYQKVPLLLHTPQSALSPNTPDRAEARPEAVRREVRLPPPCDVSLERALECRPCAATGSRARACVCFNGGR